MVGALVAARRQRGGGNARPPSSGPMLGPSAVVPTMGQAIHLSDGSQGRFTGGDSPADGAHQATRPPATTESHLVVQLDRAGGGCHRAGSAGVSAPTVGPEETTSRAHEDGDRALAPADDARRIGDQATVG